MNLAFQEDMKCEEKCDNEIEDEPNVDYVPDITTNPTTGITKNIQYLA